MLTWDEVGGVIMLLVLIALTMWWVAIKLVNAVEKEDEITNEKHQ